MGSPESRTSPRSPGTTRRYTAPAVCCTPVLFYLPAGHPDRVRLGAEVERLSASVRAIDPAASGARELVVDLRYNQLPELRETRFPMLGCRDERRGLRAAERELRRLSRLLGIGPRRREPGVVPRIERACGIRPAA